ncbi:MAG: hypothetical protein JXB39_16685 [Deltaproteobacteria bacterium]|nr:hypothetical protein [Deltaproteobacteria bacterium]
MEQVAARFAAACLLGTTACAPLETWRNADLQLDVQAALPSGAERVRICVEGAGSRALGAGPEAYAVPGIPTDGPAAITTDVLAFRDEDTGEEDAQVVARAGPVTLDADTPYAQVELEGFLDEGADPQDTCPRCPDPCVPGGSFAHAWEPSWLLVVRFHP